DAALAGAQLCSAMAANNETGVLFPLERIGEICRRRGVPLHVDAVQAAGKVPLRLSELAADYLSVSGHKLRGPQGSGLLWVRRGAKLRAVQSGGHQERGRRAGTENVAAAAGLAAALEIAVAELPEGALRFSLWSGNTEAEIDRVASLLPAIVARCRR